MKRGIQTRHRYEKVASWVYYIGYIDKCGDLIHESSVTIGLGGHNWIGPSDIEVVAQMQKEDDIYWAKVQSESLSFNYEA